MIDVFEPILLEHGGENCQLLDSILLFVFVRSSPLVLGVNQGDRWQNIRQTDADVHTRAESSSEHG